MPELINLTPHPIRVFEADTEVMVIPPSEDHPEARLGEIDLGTKHMGLGVPVEYVEYAPHGGLVEPLPPQVDGVWFIVPLVVALALAYNREGYVGRGDLLVPYDLVRNDEGTVIGCQALARPV